MLSLELFSRQIVIRKLFKSGFFKQDVLRVDPRYRKMDSFERIRYRKELKFRLIGLSCVYIGFSAWWFLMIPFSS